jgi:sarcosine oxidase
LAHQVLDRMELAAKFPQFEVPQEFIGFHEEAAGVLLPEPILSAYADAAMRLGAELHGCESVIGWTSDDAGVTVRTSRAVYRSRCAIFCGGPWTSKVVADLGVKLTVTRQVAGWVWPREPALFELGKIPCWAIDNGNHSLHYGFPMLPESPGFKVAHHALGAEADPDTVSRGYLDGDEEGFRPVLRRYLPKADGNLLAMRVCLYANTPDGHFILDRHPRFERVFLACGFSGHGFKFASVVGEAMADVALNGGTDLPIDFLRLKRFG